MDKPWLCDFAWKCLYVNTQGQVSFCACSPRPRGSLAEASLDRLWNGPQFQEARAQIHCLVFDELLLQNTSGLPQMTDGARRMKRIADQNGGKTKIVTGADLGR